MSISSASAYDKAQAFYTWFHSEGGEDYSLYDSADEMIAALSSTPEDELDAAITAVLDKIAEDSPVYPLCDVISGSAYTKGLVCDYGVLRSKTLDFTEFYWE